MFKVTSKLCLLFLQFEVWVAASEGKTRQLYGRSPASVHRIGTPVMGIS